MLYAAGHIRRMFINRWFNEAVWDAWVICHTQRSLPRCDATCLNNAVRSGIVFG